MERASTDEALTEQRCWVSGKEVVVAAWDSDRGSNANLDWSAGLLGVTRDRPRAHVAAPAETNRPGVVRLLETEPTSAERYSHAAALLGLIERRSRTPGR